MSCILSISLWLNTIILHRATPIDRSTTLNADWPADRWSRRPPVPPSPAGWRGGATAASPPSPRGSALRSPSYLSPRSRETGPPSPPSGCRRTPVGGSTVGGKKPSKPNAGRRHYWYLTSKCAMKRDSAVTAKWDNFMYIIIVLTQYMHWMLPDKTYHLISDINNY